MSKRVMAVAAHPDDIEFYMAGTMILLREAGWDLHYFNIANGSCGTAQFDTETIVAMRREESENAARKLGATFYPPLVPDLEIFYEKELLAKFSSVVRAAAPDIMLVLSPQDYMEDHMNACRLAVTAAFCHGMPNFPVDPPRPPVSNDVAVYHAQPAANRDALDKFVRPDFVVDTGDVIEEKAAVVSEHKSQKDWLDHSMGMDAFVETMRTWGRGMGALTGTFEYGEGWRRHTLGFASVNADPLREVLADRIVECGT